MFLISSVLANHGTDRNQYPVHIWIKSSACFWYESRLLGLWTTYLPKTEWLSDFFSSVSRRFFRFLKHDPVVS